MTLAPLHRLHDLWQERERVRREYAALDGAHRDGCITERERAHYLWKTHGGKDELHSLRELSRREIHLLREERHVAPSRAFALFFFLVVGLLLSFAFLAPLSADMSTGHAIADFFRERPLVEASVPAPEPEGLYMEGRRIILVGGGDYG